ncbi:MAG TPA: VCBS repeat-containing protein [Thermoanaerobaculia bacterium]|nr:VCBS repeat-containing protein [Thermoanaerobaculia bacterium]
MGLATRVKVTSVFLVILATAAVWSWSRAVFGQGLCSDLCGPSRSLIPSYTTASQGDFSTGAALVDIDKDRDRLPDLVLSNGNDMSPQALTVYYNRRGFSDILFNLRPDWYSDEIQYMGHLAVGDVNGDGWMDVAVAVVWDHRQAFGTGGVEVFLNHGGTLEKRASYRTAGGYYTAGCALGDVDADGDLDLVVPVMLEGRRDNNPAIEEGPSFFVRVEGLRPGRALIYLNHSGELSRTPAWISEEGIVAGDALVADVNQDGWMDVGFAGDHTQVYFGDPKLLKTQPVPIPIKPGWVSSDEHSFSYSLDAGFPGEVDPSSVTPSPLGKGLMVVVSSGCGPTPCTTSRFLLYQPDRSTEPVWSSKLAANASKLILADLNGDKYLDLAANQWGATFQGTPLWIFFGKAAGFPTDPDEQSQKCRVGEALAVAQLFPESPLTATHTFKGVHPAAVLTLPERWIRSIEKVVRDGRRLATNEWAWTPQSNWISLAQPLMPGESVEVEYVLPNGLSLAEAVWQPQNGSNVYTTF